MLTHIRLTRRIQLALLLYILATVVLLTATLAFQLRHLASDQISALGESLAEQLAEAIRQPLLNGDIISIQAILDQLVNQPPQVGRISAYDGDGQLLTQSQRPGLGHEELTTHERAITIDNTVTGLIRVELRSDQIASRYRQPLWVALAVWVIVTAFFAWWLLQYSHRLSQRLTRLIHKLPGGPHPEGDELTALEHRLKPLIASDDSNLEEPEDTAMVAEQMLLAITVPELDRLQNQLNASHFDRIMTTLDARVDHCLHLYGGERLHAQQGPLILSFTGSRDEDHWLKALSCARAIHLLVPTLGQNDGVALSARCALVASRHDTGLSPWRQDLQLRRDIVRLLDTVHLGAEADLVVDTNAFEDDELEFCHLEPTTDGRGYRLTGFADEQEALFEQQLAFLQTQEHQPPVTAKQP